VFKNSLICASALAVVMPAVLSGETAYAQSAPTDEAVVEASDLTLEEIVVTAERRSESLDRTALAVSKLDAEQLERGDVRSLDALQFYVPGLVSGNGTAATTIRGVGTSQLGSVVEGGVATNLDGVFIGRASATQAYFDLEGVEVLRGPQGTLYGRNSTGGVINIISARPTDEFEGSLTGIVGNYDRRRVEGVLSGPLASGLTGRLAVMTDVRSSYLENIVPGGPEVRDENVFAGRGSLRFAPAADGPVFDLIIDYTKSEGAGNVAQYLSGTISPSAPAPQLIALGRGEVAQSIDNVSEREYLGANLTAAFPIGDMTLRSISGYRESQRDGLLSGLPWSDPRSFTITDETAEQFTQEVQLVGPDGGRLEWVAGLYYFNEDVQGNYTTKAFLADLPLLLVFGIDPTNFTLFPVRYEEFLPQEFTSSSWAAYAQGTFSFTDDFRGTLGVRYTEDSKEGTGGAVDSRLVDLSGTFGVIPLGGGVATVDETWSALTPKFGLEYDLSDNTLLYGSVTNGYKPGNSNLTFGAPIVEPEFVWSYEAGIRSRLFDNRAQLNVTAYRYDYEDMQVFTVVPGPAPGSFVAAFLNAATAELSGVDVEVRAKPFEDFEVNASYGYLKSSYGDFFNSNEYLDPNALAPSTPINLNGNTLRLAPEHTLNVGAQYKAQISNGFELIPRVEFSHRSKFFATEFNNDATAQDGYSLWNARLTLVPEAAGWRLAIFGNNLADEDYFALINESQAGLASGVSGAPRTFGVELGVKF
jgi:iron complex outermembrane receptor protein